MPVHEPSWWYENRASWQARLLTPLSKIYGAVSRARMRSAPRYRSRFPVICIGNFTVGGTGKTPTALAVAELVRTLGKTPVFLTRGYGGSLKGPATVDRYSSTALEAGDEPLLLAREARTIVARDRAAGAKFIEQSCPPDSIIIMDDGLQNPALSKDFVIAVTDLRRLVGNGLCLPAGPLRAPLTTQIEAVDAVILVQASDVIDVPMANEFLEALSFKGLRLHGSVTPTGDLAWLSGARVIAYAGIANPERFFNLLRRLGAEIIQERVFPDHHYLTGSDARSLIDEARREDAQLVTTEKDVVRLDGGLDVIGELRNRSRVVPIKFKFAARSDEALSSALKRMIDGARR